MLPPDQIRNQALHVVNQAFIGLLITVDGNAVPQARWMGSALVTGSPWMLYTLTARGSRKLAHIAQNPNVTWVFSTPECADVATLFGRARVLSSPMVAQSVWDRLMDCVRDYCMSALSNESNLEVVTIETRISRIELISPRQRLYQPQTAEC
jgi:general stress protein 26